MKKHTLLLSAISVAAITTGSALEGELTGSLSLDYNSHFISYGSDVWGGGTSLTRGDTFNPALSLNFQVNDKLSFQSGFWLDINDNVSGSDFDTQETDVWFGVSYASGIATYSATYQSWNYAGDTEEILDFKVALDTFLNPSLLIHVRTDQGAAVGDEGTFAVLSGSHSFEVSERFSVSVPVAVGFALDSFHTEEDGFGYASIGLQGSYSLNDYTSLNFGLTYWTTDSDVVGNPSDEFVTYNAGVSFSF